MLKIIRVSLRFYLSAEQAKPVGHRWGGRLQFADGWWLARLQYWLCKRPLLSSKPALQPQRPHFRKSLFEGFEYALCFTSPNFDRLRKSLSFLKPGGKRRGGETQTYVLAWYPQLPEQEEKDQADQLRKPAVFEDVEGD